MKNTKQTPEILNTSEATFLQQKDEVTLQAMLKRAWAGDAVLQYELGHMYRTGERPDGQTFFALTDQGVSDYQSESFLLDYTKAFFWLTKSAMNGNAAAETDLGFMYEHGEGVSPYSEAAFDWYHQAAHKGFPPAQNNIAYFYFLGKGVKSDYQLSYAWASIAFDNGITMAKEGIRASQQKLNVAQLEEAKKLKEKILETLALSKG